MATKPKASSKKAAPKKAATNAAPKKAVTKSAPDLFNQPNAPKKAAIAKPKYTIKGNQVSRNLPALRTSTVPAVIAKPAAKPAAKSLATKMGTALAKYKGKAGMVGKGLLAAGAAYGAYKAASSKGDSKKSAPKSAPVSILKGVNRRDEIGKPLKPMVLKSDSAAKPATPKIGGGGANTGSKGNVKAKGSVNKAAAKKPAQIAAAKTLTAKDIKPSTSVGKVEIKKVDFSKPSTEAPKYSKAQIARMETRAEKKEDRQEARAERKSERMENRAERLEKRASKLKSKLKYGGAVKAKNGKSFPDLTKDGKVTKADILKGRGVIAKKGAKVRKAGFGDILGKVAGSGALGLAGMAANKLFGGKKKAAAPGGAAPAIGGAPMAAPAPAMKKGGKVAAKKKMMKSGGKMAKCKYGCK